MDLDEESGCWALVHPTIRCILTFRLAVMYVTTFVDYDYRVLGGLLSLVFPLPTCHSRLPLILGCIVLAL